ncbi:MAG: carboxypeptidase-like regulatory domain-containing protein [Nitrosopumilaceae archaeon]|nr:carboxypeptidase-like regulatory domain-containing protein [Nitrosopumilaceae archaeon]
MKIILAGLLLVALLPMVIDSEAVLWDLIISVNVENNGLFQGQSPIISGVVNDHAGKPVADVKIHVRAGQDSVFVTTDHSGQFKIVLDDFNQIPGNYIVNVKGVSPDGKTGIASVEFQVKGGLEPYSASEQKLSTPEAKKYLNMDPEFAKLNPIDFKLYNHYQAIYQEYLNEKKIAENLTEEQLFVQEQKRLAKEALQHALEEKKPGAGTYSGYKYEMFVENLDPSIRGIIENQLNYTKNAFSDAQLAMNEILENGGTYQQAREAYLEKLTITKEFMNSLTTNQTSVNSLENNTSIEILNQTSTEPIEEVDETSHNNNILEDLSLQELMGYKGVEIATDGSSIFVNVNGTTVEFIVNGTEIVNVTKPSNE